MSKKTHPPKCPRQRNPVAQHAHKTNRAIVYQDRTRYRRVGKHNKLEPFASILQVTEGGLPKVSAKVLSYYGKAKPV